MTERSPAKSCAWRKVSPRLHPVLSLHARAFLARKLAEPAPALQAFLRSFAGRGDDNDDASVDDDNYPYHSFLLAAVVEETPSDPDTGSTSCTPFRVRGWRVGGWQSAGREGLASYAARRARVPGQTCGDQQHG